MHVAILFPKLPPAHDAIGEHTAWLAQALAASHRVTVITGQGPHGEVPGVSVQPVIRLHEPEGFGAVPETVAALRPDWLVVQYNPFSYARKGLPSPALIRMLAEIRRANPPTRMLLLVHEVHPPLLAPKLFAMTAWQIPQLVWLARLADLVAFTIEPWAQHFRRLAWGRPSITLPVGSNVPLHKVAMTEARRQLGLQMDQPVIGIFGTDHPTRRLDFIDAALRGLPAAEAVQVLYIGAFGANVRKRVMAGRFVDAGRVAAADVGLYFSAMDVYLAPFRRGVSTRRGSFLTALQHGIPTVSTVGPQTGSLLRAAAGEAYVLTSEAEPPYSAGVRALLAAPERRAAMGAAAAAFYHRHFDWPLLASKLIAACRAFPDLPVTP